MIILQLYTLGCIRSVYGIRMRQMRGRLEILMRLIGLLVSTVAIIGQPTELGLLGSFHERSDNATGDQLAEVQEVCRDGL